MNNAILSRLFKTIDWAKLRENKQRMITLSESRDSKQAQCGMEMHELIELLMDGAINGAGLSSKEVRGKEYPVLETVSPYGKDFEWKDGAIRCKCGEKAIKWKDEGYLCPTITSYPCKYNKL